MREEKKLEKAAREVKYEIDMFNYMSYVLIKHDYKILNENIHDALIESFAIHAYNLFRFFYQEREKDDIIVEDFNINRSQFIKNRTPKNELEFIKDKRDKQIAHLTYDRIYRNQQTKPWPLSSIFSKTKKTIMSFYYSLSEEQKTWFNK